MSAVEVQIEDDDDKRGGDSILEEEVMLSYASSEAIYSFALNPTLA